MLPRVFKLKLSQIKWTPNTTGKPPEINYSRQQLLMHFGGSMIGQPYADLYWWDLKEVGHVEEYCIFNYSPKQVIIQVDLHR
jgi:hypothetical protein